MKTDSPSHANHLKPPDYSKCPLIFSGIRAAGGTCHITHGWYWGRDVLNWRTWHSDQVAGGKTKQRREATGEMA